MTASSDDARFALLVLFCEDTFYQDTGLLKQPIDPRLAQAGWSLRGSLLGTDALLSQGAPLDLGPRRVLYGLVLESTSLPGDYVVALRGTEGFVEWIEDALFALTDYPFGGRVEAGFWRIYASLTFCDLAGVEAPLVPSLVALFGATGSVTVVGHSLGAALATYLAVDLSSRQTPLPVAARLFASPHPGDDFFAAFAASHIRDLRAYAYLLDLVPHIPFELGYAPLPGTVQLGVTNIQARIRRSLLCCHHVLSYATLLDCTAPAFAVAALDQPYLSCILGAH